MNNTFRKLLCLCAVCGTVFAGTAAAGDSWEEQRSALLNRPRYLWNNDGGDLWHWNNSEVTPEQAYKRLNWGVDVAKKGITTYIYCPLCSAFCNQTNATRAGDRVSPPPTNRQDAVKLLTEQGTDSIQVAQKYARNNHLEFFVSLRMNDIHDVTWSNGLMPVVFPQFKKEHPEYLFGSFLNRPPAGPWSAVDYAQPEVRARMTGCFREICENYDVDGIELDFTRDPCLFKSVAWGKTAGETEWRIMDGFMRELREIAEQAGRKRNRPILLALRIPNALDYCKAVGIDAESWFARKYADILVADNWMNYDRMESTFGRIRQYGVWCYAAVDNMAVRRQTPAQQKAIRMAMIGDALSCGADGIYYFNWFNPELVQSQMTCSPEDLKGQSKLYYPNSASTDYLINRYLASGESYAKIPMVMPDMPYMLVPGKSCELVFNMTDDFSSPEVRRSGVRIKTMATVTEPVKLELSVNGTPVPLKSRGKDSLAEIMPELLKKGKNVFSVSLPDGSSSQVRHQTILAGDRILAGKIQPPWRRFMRVDDLRSAEKIEDGAYLLADRISAPGCGTSLLYPLADAGGHPLRVSFEMKLVDTDDPLAAVCRVADKRFVEIISFEPDRICFLHARKTLKFRTDDDFHWYRIRMTEKQLVFEADGKERIRVPLVRRADDPEARLPEYVQSVRGMHNHSLILGSISGQGKGATLWKNVKLDRSGVGLRDFSVSVEFPEEPPKTVLPFGESRISWDIGLDAAAGDFRIPGADANSYLRNNAKLRDGAFHLIHDSGETGAEYQGIFLGGHPKLKGSGILAVEWECAVEKEGFPAEQPVFNVYLKPAAADGKAYRETNILVGPAGIQTRLGKISGHFSDGQMHMFRAVLNPENGDFALWMDGKAVQQGKLPAGSAGAQIISFGDLSGGVGGQARLKSIRFAKIKK